MQRGRATGLGIHLQPQQLQPGSEGLQGLGQIVHQQRAQALQRHRHGTVTGLLGAAKPGREPEAAALARCALQPHLTAHQQRQVAGQGQAQAGAAVAPGGGAVTLLKGIEQRGLALSRNAFAGVLHLKAQLQHVAVLAQQLATQPHPTFAGELDGVGQQVDQRLGKTGRIPPQAGGQVVGVQHQLQPFFTRPAVHHLKDPGQHAVE